MGNALVPIVFGAILYPGTHWCVQSRSTKLDLVFASGEGPGFPLNKLAVFFLISTDLLLIIHH